MKTSRLHLLFSLSLWSHSSFPIYSTFNRSNVQPLWSFHVNCTSTIFHRFFILPSQHPMISPSAYLPNLIPNTPLNSAIKTFKLQTHPTPHRRSPQAPKAKWRSLCSWRRNNIYNRILPRCGKNMKHLPVPCLSISWVIVAVSSININIKFHQIHVVLRWVSVVWYLLGTWVRDVIGGIVWLGWDNRVRHRCLCLRLLFIYLGDGGHWF